MSNRVIGILAHVDAGKTTLSEAILYTAGAIRKFGRVDNKDAFLDNFELERKRGITIFSKQAVLKLPEKFTLLDTPGHNDFQAETFKTLSVLDYAIFVINAAENVNSHTISLLKILNDKEIPTFIFLNKMDMTGADAEKILSKLGMALDNNFVRFTKYEGDKVVDLTAKDSDGRDTFLENVATSDEEVLNRFLEGEEISDDEIAELIAKRRVTPVFEGSALKNKGARELLMGLQKYTLEMEYSDEPGFFTYKISRDDKEKKLNHVKIVGGQINVRDVIDGEKITEIRLYNGEKYENLSSAVAGDIVTLMGLDSVMNFGEGEEYVDDASESEPVMTYQMVIPDGVSINDAVSKLKLLNEEDPSLNITYNEELKEVQISIFGKVQMEILKSVILKRFGFEVEFENGKIVYKETINSPIHGAGHFEPLRHYAEVHLRMEPGKRGSGITVRSECSTDLLALNWQRLIATHLTEREFRGVLTGSPLTDVCFVIVAGRAHNKHTEGGDFREATYRAVRQGLMKAENQLLEPYYSFRLSVPSEFIGRAINDFDSMKATFSQPILEGDNSVITGKVAVSAISDYRIKLSAYTKGAGILELENAGYDVCKNAAEVIEEKGYDPDADVRNPSGSVFCSHGAGVYVPWDEADEKMHVLPDGAKEELPMEVKLKQIQREINAHKASEEDLNAIFEKTYGKSDKNRRTRFKYKRNYRNESPKISGSHSYSTKEEYEKVRKQKGNEGEKILLVDGYNVIYAWKDLSELAKENLEAARTKLADTLSEYAAFHDLKLILVFDAYKVKGNMGEVNPYHNIYVVYTKEAQTADEYIGRSAIKLGPHNRVTVATSDAMIQLIIRGNNCVLMSSRELAENVERTKEQIREQL